jgi:hypothetical protein
LISTTHACFWIAHHLNLSQTERAPALTGSLESSYSKHLSLLLSSDWLNTSGPLVIFLKSCRLCIDLRQPQIFPKVRFRLLTSRRQRPKICLLSSELLSFSFNATMLNMSAIGNRNSTPVESSNSSSLRPPSARAIGSGHHLRASADMAAFSSPTAASRIRPSSDFYGTQSQSQGGGEVDPNDKIAQQWIADIDQYEMTLEEMAAATLDQDFKDELSAIEQWFRVLSEAERTAALYALLQQTTQVQCRFFVQILQQLGKNHPVSGVLSPANFDKGWFKFYALYLVTPNIRL